MIDHVILFPLLIARKRYQVPGSLVSYVYHHGNNNSSSQDEYHIIRGAMRSVLPFLTRGGAVLCIGE